MAMAEHTTDHDREEWAVEQRGLDGDQARGQATLDGGIRKDADREGSTDG
jgi:hypothetical protein